MLEHPVTATADPEATRRHHELDRLIKTVMALDGGRVLRWLFTPALCRLLRLPDTVPRLVRQLDKEFAHIKRIGDYLLEVLFAVLMMVVHFEFQRRPDSQMGQRMLQYQGGVKSKHESEVVSLVLHVRATQSQTFKVEEYVLGPMSRIGWVSISLPHLVADWPRETDSPMAEMMRALVEGELSTAYLRRLRDRLMDLGLSEEDCRQMMLMLSFLLEIRRGGDGSRYEDIVKEVLAMLQLEDSWVYQAGAEREIKKLQQMAVELSRECFGRDLQGERHIQRIQDSVLLAKLIRYLGTAATLADAFSAAGIP